MEFEKVHENGPLFRKIKLCLLLAKLKAKLGLRKMGFMIAVIFKETPKDTLMKKLISKGFDFVTIPNNAYIKPEIEDFVIPEKSLKMMIQK